MLKNFTLTETQLKLRTHFIYSLLLRNKYFNQPIFRLKYDFITLLKIPLPSGMSNYKNLLSIHPSITFNSATIRMISLHINVTRTTHLRGGKAGRVCNIDRPNCVQVQGPNKNYPRERRTTGYDELLRTILS